MWWADSCEPTRVAGHCRAGRRGHFRPRLPLAVPMLFDQFPALDLDEELPGLTLHPMLREDGLLTRAAQ